MQLQMRYLQLRVRLQREGHRRRLRRHRNHLRFRTILCLRRLQGLLGLCTLTHTTTSVVTATPFPILTRIPTPITIPHPKPNSFRLTSLAYTLPEQAAAAVKSMNSLLKANDPDTTASRPIRTMK